MAKVIIKRKNQLSGSAVKHDVYLDDKCIGILKNGGVIGSEVSVGSHTLFFKSRLKVNKKNAETEFHLVINEENELVEVEGRFNASGEYVAEYADKKIHLPDYNFRDGKGIRCPLCGSTDLTTITETFTEGKDFNSSNAFCGYLLCGPLGLLLGADKKGKQQHTNSFWVCKNCGNKFKM